jgi:hypothetical protein
MRADSFQLIKFCGTRTDPAAKTKSIGLQANALVPCFLLATWTALSLHEKSCPFIGTTPSGQLRHDTKYSFTYRDFAKTHANPDTDGNSLNRRAVRSNGGACFYMGTNGDFQSSLLADAKSLKKKRIRLAKKNLGKSFGNI